MTIILSYCHKDSTAAMALARLLATRTNMTAHELVLYASSTAKLPSQKLIDDLEATALKLAVIQCTNDAADYPLGPNLQVAGLFTKLQSGDFKTQKTLMLIEPDGFPRCADWADRIQAAHDTAGRAVSGHYIHWVDPKHYNGNLCIDREFIEATPVLRRPVITAWDCHHAELLAENGAENPEIYLPRHPEPHMPTDYWLTTRKNGHLSAYVHGSAGFAVIEHITREGFPTT
jgi:hypothetical protein